MAQGEINELFELETHSEILEDTARDNSNSVNIKPECRAVPKQPAVCIRSGSKSYGTKKDRVVVLDGLNMTVQKGIIYGLLGSSGCGKTTLLSCVLGLKKLNSGEISVLGRPFTSRCVENLGSRVGYMPQEIALYGDFTIRETLSFFGWIVGMTSKNIKERMSFLVNLLALPNVDQLVETLSGGQQRRVSLAAALLHEPELLILDEPTVGLDSVLRDTIWRHFSDITKERRATVIITTHYIDEAHQADRIALMRKGHFLAEDAPNRLLDQYGFGTLEALFFKLSYSQDILTNQEAPKITTVFVDKEINNGPSSAFDHHKVGGEVNCVLESEEVSNTKSSKCLVYQSNHMKALLWKNWLWMIRHMGLMIAVLISPFSTVALFMSCIGNNPINIPIAVVNYETNTTSITCDDKLTCNSSYLGCHYFKYIEEHDLKLIPYDSETSAIESVLTGETYASIVVKQNYSSAVHYRVHNWLESSVQDIEFSKIYVFRDISNHYVANYLKQLFYDDLKKFLEEYMEICGIASTVVTTPIRWETPVYGKKDSRFSEFVVTGIILLYICFLATYMTTSTTMIERQEGLLERILVIGISRTELITSHMLCQFVIMISQTILSLICVFVIFTVTLKGSLLLVTILTILTGCCGIFFGLCLSCICDREQTAAYAVVGTGFPLLVLSGILWPLEGMHHVFKHLAIFLPFTHAIESMRNIMQKGWGITVQAVYIGFVSMIMWTVFFLILSIVILRFSKK